MTADDVQNLRHELGELLSDVDFSVVQLPWAQRVWVVFNCHLPEQHEQVGLLLQNLIYQRTVLSSPFVCRYIEYSRRPAAGSLVEIKAQPHTRDFQHLEKTDGKDEYKSSQ